QHYTEEYDFDFSTNPDAWLKEKAGLHIAFGSEDALYFRTEVPATAKSQTWQATGWKGERLNTQLIAWSPDSLKQIHFVISDLKNENGRILSRKNIQLNKVCYVLSNYPYNAGNADCGEGPTNKAWLMPDRFESFDRFDLPGKTVRPVWLSLNIPV